MWHETTRFVRCAKNAFDLPPPVHEYGLATVSTLKVSSPDPQAPGEAGDSTEDRIHPLEDLESLPYPDGSAGTVACLDILQHVADPGAVAAEMIRLLAPGGILLVCSCTGGRLTTNVDLLWRPAPHAFQRLLAPLEATLIGWQGREGDPHSIYAIGSQAPVTPTFLAGANRFLKAFREALDRERRAVSWFKKAREWFARLSGRQVTGRGRADYFHSQFVMHAPVDRQFQHEAMGECLQQNKTGTRFDFTQ